jgi:hypothetical protein
MMLIPENCCDITIQDDATRSSAEVRNADEFPHSTREGLSAEGIFLFEDLTVGVV